MKCFSGFNQNLCVRVRVGVRVCVYVIVCSASAGACIIPFTVTAIPMLTPVIKVDHSCVHICRVHRTASQALVLIHIWAADHMLSLNNERPVFAALKTPTHVHTVDKCKASRNVWSTGQVFPPDWMSLINPSWLFMTLLVKVAEIHQRALKDFDSISRFHLVEIW